MTDDELRAENNRLHSALDAAATQANQLICTRAEAERLRAQLAECHAELRFIAQCPMEQRCAECTRRAAYLLRRHGREVQP